MPELWLSELTVYFNQVLYIYIKKKKKEKKKNKFIKNYVIFLPPPRAPPPPPHIPILHLFEKFWIYFLNFFFCLEYELHNVFSKNFTKFTLGKVWDLFSEFLFAEKFWILVSNWPKPITLKAQYALRSNIALHSTTHSILLWSLVPCMVLL
jgi:hypothetical protein